MLKLEDLGSVWLAAIPSTTLLTTKQGSVSHQSIVLPTSSDKTLLSLAFLHARLVLGLMQLRLIACVLTSVL